METLSDSIHVDGQEIFLSLRIRPEPGVETLIEWEFDSPHPHGAIAIRVRAFRCSFRFPGVDQSQEVLGVHGQANRGWVVVDQLGDDPVVSIMNTGKYTGYSRFDATASNQAMLIDETAPGTYVIRANNDTPADRMAFCDFTATVKVTTLNVSTNRRRRLQYP